MISAGLLRLVRCPECHAALRAPSQERAIGPEQHERPDLHCSGCGRIFPQRAPDYLELTPSRSHEETTKFLEEGFHADGRDETVAPPLLSAGVRNTMLRKFLAPSAGDMVLDLGCGSGRFAVWNLGSGAHIVGIDAGTFFAAEARERVDLVVGELRKLPFADRTVNKAYAIDVLEHLSEDGLGAFLREVSRVLAPGGALFIYTHVMQLSPFAPLLRAIFSTACALERAGLADLTVDRLRPTDHLNPLRDRKHLDQVAHHAGFRVARFRYYTPVLSRIAESIVVPVAAHALAKKKAAGAAVDSGSLRAARLDAKQRLSQRGVMYRGLKLLTAVTMLDVSVLGRIRSGPFFALLIKT